MGLLSSRLQEHLDKFDKNKLLDQLRKNICEVVFIKADGTERTMRATLHPKYLGGKGNVNAAPDSNTTTVNDVVAAEDGTPVTKAPAKRKGNVNPDLISLYDIEATGDGWRSFKISTMRKFNVIEEVK